LNLLRSKTFLVCFVLGIIGTGTALATSGGSGVGGDASVGSSSSEAPPRDQVVLGDPSTIEGEEVEHRIGTGAPSESDVADCERVISAGSEGPDAYKLDLCRVKVAMSDGSLPPGDYTDEELEAALAAAE
jgi:hypothetical protein